MAERRQGWNDHDEAVRVVPADRAEDAEERLRQVNAALGERGIEYSAETDSWWYGIGALESDEVASVGEALGLAMRYEYEAGFHAAADRANQKLAEVLADG